MSSNATMEDLLAPLVAEIKALRSEVASLAETVKTVSFNQEEMVAKQDAANAIVYELSSFRFDAYEAMSQSSGVKLDEEILRKKYIKFHKDAAIGAGKDRQVFCSVSGYQPNDNVKLAHICPKSSNPDIRKLLGLSEKDVKTNFRNVILLSWNIERCFDRKLLSFVQKDPLHDTLIMKIWDEEIKNMPIFDGSPQKIGDFEGQPLTFLKRQKTYRRCFAYQELCALNHHVRRNNFDGMYDDILEGHCSEITSFIDHREKVIKDLRHLQSKKK